MMERVRELRQRAALCRRAAGPATAGGSADDRLLLHLAERLEQEAAARERALLGEGSGV